MTRKPPCIENWKYGSVSGNFLAKRLKCIPVASKLKRSIFVA